jgi:hypothetical protein
MSHTSRPGLLGVSSHSSLAGRGPSSTSSCASPAVGAVRASMPYAAMRARTRGSSWYPSSGSTAASPGRTRPSSTALVAAMPEAKTTASAGASGDSSPAIARSSALQVGLASRP